MNINKNMGEKTKKTKTVEVCPFCGWGKTVVIEENHYYCTECETFFDEDGVEFEDLRHKVSAYCSDAYATEEKPLKCDIIIKDDEVLNLHLVGIFHDCEAIVWLNIEQYNEPVEFDKLSLRGAKKVLSELTY